MRENTVAHCKEVSIVKLRTAVNYELFFLTYFDDVMIKMMMIMIMIKCMFGFNKYNNNKW